MRFMNGGKILGGEHIICLFDVSKNNSFVIALLRVPYILSISVSDNVIFFNYISIKIDVRKPFKIQLNSCNLNSYRNHTNVRII